MDINIAVVLMIIVSILLGVLIYSKSGAIGRTISPILGGLMGPIKYIIPITYKESLILYKSLSLYNTTGILRVINGISIKAFKSIL